MISSLNMTNEKRSFGQSFRQAVLFQGKPCLAFAREASCEATPRARSRSIRNGVEASAASRLRKQEQFVIALKMWPVQLPVENGSRFRSAPELAAHFRGRLLHFFGAHVANVRGDRPIVTEGIL
jgi:hypothetical protein